MSTKYLYRRGDGNEGNFLRALVRTNAGDNPWSLLRALVLNDYIAGKSRRRYIASHIEVDGDPDCGIQATVYEGPRGATAFGAAWLTASLELLSEEDAAHYEAQPCLAQGWPKALLDRGAFRIFKRGEA